MSFIRSCIHSFIPSVILGTYYVLDTGHVGACSLRGAGEYLITTCRVTHDLNWE